MSLANYKYPAKLKKFGIDDPFLNIVVAKYENEIAWQSVVKDQHTLIKFIKEIMLPVLMEQIKWPLGSNAKHFYVSKKHVDVDRALTTDHELDQEQIELIRKTKTEKGLNEATELLVNIINKRKKQHFDLWIKLMETNYKDQPAYQILLLRPMFEQAGYGSRRAVVTPDKDVIEWLFKRITNGRLNPNHNFAKIYFLKSAFKSSSIIQDGWTFVHKGEENAPRLCALSRGSGWCVASEDYARAYLSDYSFYILYSKGSPVVALKADGQKRVISECEGRNNESPIDWFYDIHFFISTMKLKMDDRLEDYYSALDSLQKFNDHKEWWIQRKKLWYFSIEHAPDIIKGAISTFETKDLYKYIEFISLQELSKQLGIEFSTEDYIQLIKINPALYGKIPEEILNKNKEKLNEACKSGWIEQIEDKELTRKELLKVQSFIKENNEFIQAIAKSFPEDLKKISLRNPKISAKKTTRFILENTMPVSENEPIDLSVIRAANLILNNETSDFSDIIFPKEMLEHESFPIIREKGWEKVIIENPAFRLALPKDLEVKKNFLFDKSKMKLDLLLKWTKNVEQKPWLLTQKNVVPKSVRYSQEILQSYVRGWIPFIRKAPYKLWCKSGSRFSKRGRANMSYALLRNYEFLSAMIDGYKFGFETKQNYWGYASPSVKQISACCFSYLVAATLCGEKQVISDLKKDPIKLTLESNDPIIKGITDLLKNRGKNVLNLFYGENKLEYFQLSQFKENIDFTRKIRYGDTINVLFDGKELLVFMGNSNKGYYSIKKGSEEYKALIGLRKGEKFQIGPLGGKVIEILDPH